MAESDRLIMLPFAVLLLAIALGPVIAQHHWERHYHKLCIALAAVVCGYYVVVREVAPVLHALVEYVSFIVVVGAFFVVSGGIHLRVKAPSNPVTNSLFLFFGAVLANLIGTIGASTLLIRPWIAMNRRHIAPMHIAFFIFLVSNIGGALLPVGPPLFLGFLKGVPFAWPLQHCWAPWLITIALVLFVFFIIDLARFRTAATKSIRTTNLSGWRCDGSHNFLFLFALLATLVAVHTGWREPVLILIALGSYLGTPKRIRDTNDFTFAPLKEVAWLFLGIFGTMIPVLEFMEHSSGKLGLQSIAEFYWATGLLSALLDNAPTYLAFFAAALGLHGFDLNQPAHVTQFLASNGHELVAISLGAAFFGALTYIGNSPNMLVKTIAEHARVPTPGFIDYIWRFALPVLLPIFALIAILYLSR
jgi:Na+/H+ antiporter NhaD/arsenite permease-like protein